VRRSERAPRARRHGRRRDLRQAPDHRPGAIHRGEQGAGRGRGSLREVAVPPLPRSRVRFGVPGQGARQDGGRPGRLSRGSLHRVPLLHDRLSFRRAEVSVRQGHSLRPQVHDVPRPSREGREARLRRELPGRGAHVRQAQRAPRRGEAPRLCARLQVRPRDLRRARGRRDVVDVHRRPAPPGLRLPARRRRPPALRNDARGAGRRPVRDHALAAAAHGSLHGEPKAQRGSSAPRGRRTPVATPIRSISSSRRSSRSGSRSSPTASRSGWVL
jgi:hypothetical protein